MENEIAKALVLRLHNKNQMTAVSAQHQTFNLNNFAAERKIKFELFLIVWNFLNFDLKAAVWENKWSRRMHDKNFRLIILNNFLVFLVWCHKPGLQLMLMYGLVCKGVTCRRDSFWQIDKRCIFVDKYCIIIFFNFFLLRYLLLLMIYKIVC